MFGYSATGNGSNSVTLGNDNITKTILKGKIGIGTNSPTALVTTHDGVTGEPSDDSGGMKIKLWDSATDYYDYGIGIATGKFWILRGQDAKFSIYENGPATTADFTIDGEGNVGINTTTPSKKLYVNGSAGGTTGWNASDKREKTEIKPIENALDNVSKLRGISYKWKEGDEDESKGFDNRIHFGVIAQEVEVIYPELVDNLGLTKLRKHVEYNALVGILIEALKELKNQNDVLEVKIEAQQAQIDKLSAMIKNLNI